MREDTKRILVEYDRKIDRNKDTIANGEFLVDGFAGVGDTSRLGFTQDELNDLNNVEQYDVEGFVNQPIDRPIQERINDYDEMVNQVDTRLVAIASSITTIKLEIFDLIQVAIGTETSGINTVGVCTTTVSPGCGTLTGLCTVYCGGITTCLEGYGELSHDIFQVRVSNASSRSYTGIDPTAFSVQTLSVSNVGVGSFNIISKDGGAGIGSTALITNVGGCSTYYTSVTNKYAEIDTLRSEADTLISKINEPKREKHELESYRWGVLYSNQQAVEENSRLEAASAAIQSDELGDYV